MKACVTKILVLIFLPALISCVGMQSNIFETTESQAKLRSIQSRVFDIADRNRLLRTIIATMQDLGFVIDSADETLGTVSGTKRANFYSLIMTVSVRPKGEHQMIVRSNARYNLQTVEDPEPYQQFFAALSRALFLEAHANPSAGISSATGSNKSAGAEEKPKKTAFSVNIHEPWTGVWKVEGYRIFVGKWSLKQHDSKVVSTDKSSHKIDSQVVKRQLKGKVIFSSKDFPFTIKIASDGLSFKGTSIDYYGRSVFIKGERIE